MSSIGACAPRFRAGKGCSPAAERRGAVTGPAMGPGGGAGAANIGSGAGTWDGIGPGRASRAGSSGKGEARVATEGVAGVSGLRGRVVPVYVSCCSRNLRPRREGLG